MLALFVDERLCPAVLERHAGARAVIPGVRFAAVAIKGNRGCAAQARAQDGLSSPSAIDKDGALAALYKLVELPADHLRLPGGVVQSKALLSHAHAGALRARVAELRAASRARGWRRPARERPIVSIAESDTPRPELGWMRAGGRRRSCPSCGCSA